MPTVVRRAYAGGIGRVEIARLPERPRAWVIGAAPQELPYWKLRNDSGRTIAGLALLFENEFAAWRIMGNWLDRNDERLKGTVQRTVRDLKALPTAWVGSAIGEPQLHAWADAVAGRRAGLLPSALDHPECDVLLLPERVPSVARFGVVRMAALNRRVRCENPRPLKWPAPRDAQ